MIQIAKTKAATRVNFNFGHGGFNFGHFEINRQEKHLLVIVEIWEG